MRYFLLAPALLLLFAFGDIPRESGKSPLEYKVTFSRKQPGLAIHKAMVELIFLTQEGKKISDSILMSSNGTQFTVHPDSSGKAFLSIKPGKNKFQFYYNSEYSEIYTDSIDIRGGCLTGLEVTFHQALKYLEVDKPVIYFYPEKTQDVSVELNVLGELGFTYPKYNGAWNFTADPNGTIHMDEKEYDYLFWDAKSQLDVTKTDIHAGFIVNKDSLTGFFETQLTAMGLTPREQQDFITYWCPLMQDSEKSYVHFMFNEECNSIATLDITPTPDHIFRVYMIWSDASEINPATIHEQKIESFHREGFSVVEWGGANAEFISDML